MCYVARRTMLVSYHDSRSEALANYRDAMFLSISGYPTAYIPWRSYEDGSDEGSAVEYQARTPACYNSVKSILLSY